MHSHSIWLETHSERESVYLELKMPPFDFFFLASKRIVLLNKHSLLSALNLWNRKGNVAARHALRAQMIFISSPMLCSKLRSWHRLISPLQLEGGELWLPHPKPISEGIKTLPALKCAQWINYCTVASREEKQAPSLGAAVTRPGPVLSAQGAQTPAGQRKWPSARS